MELRASSISKASIKRKRSGATRMAKSSTRTLTTMSAATRSFTARRSSAFAKKTLARSATTAASRPPGRSPMMNSNPTIFRQSISTTSTASAAKTRPTRPQAAHTHTLRSAMSRASSTSATTSLARGLGLFTCLSALCWTRRIRRRASAYAVIRATASRVWWMQSQTRRCARWTRRCSIRT